MSLWTELPWQFGMFLHSALLSILAELAVLHFTAKKTSGPIQQAKPVSESAMAFTQIKYISTEYCHSFLFSCGFQKERSEPCLYCKSSVPYPYNSVDNTSPQALVLQIKLFGENEPSPFLWRCFICLD